MGKAKVLGDSGDPSDADSIRVLSHAQLCGDDGVITAEDIANGCVLETIFELVPPSIGEGSSST